MCTVTASPEDIILPSAYLSLVFQLKMDYGVYVNILHVINQKKKRLFYLSGWNVISCVHVLCGATDWKRAACCTINPASNTPKPNLQKRGGDSKDSLHYLNVCMWQAEAKVLRLHPRTHVNWTRFMWVAECAAEAEKVLMAQTWGGNKSLTKMMLSSDTIASRSAQAEGCCCAACNCLEDWFWTMCHLTDCNQASLFIPCHLNLGARDTMADP